jgi:hypothetical protein
MFPAGVALSATAAGGPAVGYGLTSFDVDFDNRIDSLRITHERDLPSHLDGLQLDFDGDGVLDTFSTNGVAGLRRHGGASAIQLGPRPASSSSTIFFSSARQATAARFGRVEQRQPGAAPDGRALGRGGWSPATAGRRSCPSGGSNLDACRRARVRHLAMSIRATVRDPGRGPRLAHPARWRPHPGQNLTRRPWFLKRFYVDGHEYNVVGIGTCAGGAFQSITLRAPIPKVPVTIEQHSVSPGYPPRIP